MSGSAWSRARHIAGFELRQQLRSPAAVIGALIFFLMAFGATTVDQIQIGSRGNVHLNAPMAVQQITAAMNLFAVFVIVAMVASVVVRDDESGFATLVHATPVGKAPYLLGRYAGALGAAVLVMASVPAGIALGALMPWLDPEKLGPFQASTYLYAVFVTSLPTLLVVSAVLFALVTWTRSTMAGYVGAVALLVAYIALAGWLREPAWEPAAALLDPFGLTPLRVSTKYWTAAEQNLRLPALEGLLLANRLLWSGLALVVMGLAYASFRFERRSRRKNAPPAPVDEALPLPPPARPGAAQASRGTPTATALQFWRLARHEAVHVLRSPGFAVLLVIGVLNALAVLLQGGRWYGASSLPVTRLMIDGLQGGYTIVPLLIAIYYGGELVWRDRERRFHEIVDATAAPNLVHLLPKVLAITGVLLATALVGVLTALAVQAAQGWFRFELGHYVLWFVLPTTITAVLAAVLSVAVQSLVPQKPIGWAVMMLWLVGAIALSSAGFEHNLYQYAGEPQVPLSDMNGLGRFWISRAWFQAYWGAFAVLLIVMTLALWRRGAATPLRLRARGAWRRLGTGARWTGALALVAWVGLGAWIYVNTNVWNRYRPQPLQDAELAEVERQYLALAASLPTPSITTMAVDVQLFPRETRAVTTGSYRLENRSGRPISTLLVWLPEKLVLDRFELDGASLEHDDARLGVKRWRLEPALAPGEVRTLRFATTLAERGFPNHDPLTRLVDNGSFVDDTAITPRFGIPDHRLLSDRSKRRRQGLPPDLRPPSLDDESGRAHGYFGRDADWVTADITITTDADQTPIAPGRTVEDTTRDGRRRMRFVTDAPIVPFFSIQSGRYAVQRDRWGAVDLAVYHHPGHEANVPRMLAAMKASLALFSEQFSPYPFHQARIIEFPAYESFAQSFANTIPYSETLGFIAKPPDPAHFDVVSYVTAHEIAHQWWGHQLNPSRQQGGSMLVESLAQYSALLVMEQLAGREQIGRFLKYELDRYLRSRGSEAVEEVPLARVEDQPYIHYNKGSVVMWSLKEAVGADVVNRTLARLLREHGYASGPYPNTRDFLRLLRAEAGPAHDALITDLFERIVLLDQRTRSATAARRPDGRVDVTLEVEARRFVADGLGRETEEPFDEEVPVGVFGVAPDAPDFGPRAVLHQGRARLHSGTQTLVVTVDRTPTHAGIDPYHVRIDRRADDNVIAVPAPSEGPPAPANANENRSQ